MVLSLPVRTLFAATLLRSLAAPLAPLACWAPLCFLSAAVCQAETVLLDFSSPTCGPCQEMRPIVQRLVSDGLPVREVDITREPQLAARFGVTRVPTFLMLVDGDPVERVVGKTSYRQLQRMMRRALPAPAPRQPTPPQGQSPDRPSTFAASPAVVTPIAGPNNARSPANRLSQPHAGRVVTLQDRSARTARPTAYANSLSNTPPALTSRPNLSAAQSPGPTSPAAGSPNSLHQRLLAATVKITVEDPQGKSAGTGTVVDARSGEALILTCGHLFRCSAGQGAITVTTFQVSATGATPTASYRGQLIDFDLQRDLALVSMRPTAPVQAVSIAATSVSPLAPDVAVTSVGCNHGQDPTVIDSIVTAVNRYQGTPNVEVAGAPVEGRSGGGLFNAQAQLVGVCYAADPQGNEGLYAALPAIYAKLDSLNLAMIYRPEATNPQVAQTVPANSPPPSAATELPVAVRGQEPDATSRLTSPFQTGPAVAPLSPAEQAALEEIRRRTGNSEVICIIRPQDPTAKSEVISLNNVSPAFVRALAAPASAGQFVR